MDTAGEMAELQRSKKTRRRASSAPAARAGVLLVLALVSTFAADAEASKGLDGCKNKLVSVIDLDVMFKDEVQGRPPCFASTLMVSPHPP